MKPHSERKHSKFAASASERWFNCPGSVELSEGLPDKSSPYAQEGTTAHEVLESILALIVLHQGTKNGPDKALISFEKKFTKEMVGHGTNAANFILSYFRKLKGSELLSEQKVYLDFIHPEMFGTFDAAVIDHFGTLHVFDYKYGAGVAVSAEENLQMIFYGIGLAHRYAWNFSTIRHWIIQPRIRGYDGPTYWDETMKNVRGVWVPRFVDAVERVRREPETFVEGGWCHWCKAKSICPLKRDAKFEKAQSIFGGIS